jgi:hypothetical protein
VGAVSQRLESDGFAVVTGVIDGVRRDQLAAHLRVFGKSVRVREHCYGSPGAWSLRMICDGIRS